MEEKIPRAGHADAGCFFCEVARPFFEALWPEASRDHFRNSRVEFLKGIRSIIDGRIEQLSREHQKGTHVPVE